jgi:hypothetical protein
MTGPFATAARNRVTASSDNGIPQLRFTLSYGTDPNWIECRFVSGVYGHAGQYADRAALLDRSAKTRPTAPPRVNDLAGDRRTVVVGGGSFLTPTTSESTPLSGGEGVDRQHVAICRDLSTGPSGQRS